MVNLIQRVDISDLKGLKAVDSLGQPWKIVQALQETKVKMNEKGAKVESAVAIVGTLECCVEEKKELVIDRPFFMWVERQGMKRPLFAGYMAPDCWKDPGRDL